MGMTRGRSRDAGCAAHRGRPGTHSDHGRYKALGLDGSARFGPAILRILASTDAGAPLAGDVIGRESELAILHSFLDSIPTGPSALLLSGDPGIGKTTVWKEGLADAQLRRYRTLSCGPVEAETRLSYAALGDLLEPILEEALPTVPEPQRQALEVALLRSPRSGARADQRALSLAVLGCLRSVASTSPIVLAVDDVQWMDTPSIRVLQFVVRRLKDEQVGLMTAARGARADDDPLGVGSAFAEDRVHAVHVGPLSLDALEQVLRTKVGEGFSRTTLLNLHEMSGGNPSFAAEVTWRPARGFPSRTASRYSSRTASRGFPRRPSKRSRSSRLCRLRRWMPSLPRPILPRSTVAWVRRSRTASSRSATAFGSPTPSSRPPSIRRSRRPGVASCTRGSRRSSAIRRNEPATWPFPSRARTSPSPPPWRRPPHWPSPGERRNLRPSSGRWPAAPRRRTGVRIRYVGPTGRAWLTTSAGTPRWREASWSKRWTSRWPGRLGPACCWTWGWPSPRTKGGGGPGPCSRLLGARRGTISRSGHGSSRISGTPGCSEETSRHRSGTLAQRCSWPRSCRNRG